MKKFLFIGIAMATIFTVTSCEPEVIQPVNDPIVQYEDHSNERPAYFCPHFHGRLAGWPTPNPNNLVECRNCHCAYWSKTFVGDTLVYLGVDSATVVYTLKNDPEYTYTFSTDEFGHWDTGDTPDGTYDVVITKSGLKPYSFEAEILNGVDVGEHFAEMEVE